MRNLSVAPVLIREYRPQDLSTLHRIDRICFAPEIAFSRPELLFYVRHPHSISRVAERDGRIVGFAVGRVEHGTPVTSLPWMSSRTSAGPAPAPS